MGTTRYWYVSEVVKYFEGIRILGTDVTYVPEEIYLLVTDAIYVFKEGKSFSPPCNEVSDYI